MSPRLRTALAAIVAAALVFGAAACGDDEPTPEEARYQRVEELFQAAFGDEQAECMLRQFDDEMIASLDGPGALPEGAALEEFSAIARACVTGDGTPELPDDDPSPTTEPDAVEGSTPDEGEPTDPEQGGGEGEGEGEGEGGEDDTEGGSTPDEEAPESTQPDATTTTDASGVQG